ncbi:MAG: alpha/beta hydrolase [Desulfobacteraceae bacterium]|nr:alpha/beta hydrolase [Desulfobacteraceae bacterium]
MDKNQPRNYSILDQPLVLAHLFHPRREDSYRPLSDNRDDLMISVDETEKIGASFHHADNLGPVILFFHGNGEIVSDYDDIGILFARMGINFCVADYRGYGSSTGHPTVSSMMSDCRTIYLFLKAYLEKKSYTGPVCIMGRSLGSAPALELAATYPEAFKTLIIESGFAYAGPLLRTIGVSPEAIGFEENLGFENIDKIKLVTKPSLIIHAQFDHIIPFSDGQALYDASPSKEKQLLEVKDANHNDIFLRGMDSYLFAVKNVCL